ncbi:MAG: hypothetical protein ABIO44_06865 [Saprospiraceae bacterium]
MKLENINQDFQITIDTIFAPGESVENLFKLFLYTSKKNIDFNAASGKYSFWVKGNIEFSNFRTLISKYDIVYLQNQTLVDNNLNKIIEAIIRINPQVRIFIFQNFIPISWSELIRESKAKEQLKFFNKQVSNRNISLIRIGDYINDAYKNDGSNTYLDNNLHLTNEGTNLLIHLFNSKIKEYYFKDYRIIKYIKKPCYLIK